MKQFHPGDLVQVTVEQEDEGECIARAGAIGHVLAAPAVGRWPNIYFERTGRVSVVDPDELMFLGDADTGRKDPRTERTHGN